MRFPMIAWLLVLLAFGAHAAEPDRRIAIKIDEDTRERVKRLAEARHRTTHWMLREAVRQFVEEAQPQIALFGHIHEAARIAGSCVARIGKTLCINPGAEHSDGVQAVIVNTDSIEVEKVFKGEKVFPHHA